MYAGSGTVPAATGGSIQSGTYTLTAATYYPSSGGTFPPGYKIGTAQSTIEISGSSFVETSNSSAMASQTLQGTFSTAGTSFYLLASCPTSGELIWAYSASTGTLTFNVPVSGDGGGAGTLVETFSVF
jgi:hypothetical protein